ncbi:MAG: cytochrome c peroxidase, partial [Gammaproteobacteria bacterium]|nr:cytochrome c peroxidase [Gammaproteobacteria bacterium]
MSLSSLAGKAGLLVVLGSLAACGGGSGSDTDTTLSEIIAEKGLTGDPAAGRDLPAPTDPVAVLGKKLFFAKSLGGDMDSACVTCHHPMLGGGDKLSLSVGVGAVEPDLLGPGREDVGGDPRVPRNAPTVFNMGLYDVSLFHDGRVQVLTLAPGANGEGVEIDTPDSDLVNPDPNAGDNLIAAQARFPITSNSEMRGVNFEPFGSNQQVRDHLAARLGDYGVGAGELARTEWLAEFQAAYASALGASELVTYDNIAFAMGEYQRSMVFASNAWKDYVAGDEAALSESQKRGAVLFFKDVADGGAGCASCHSGDFFTDENFHVLAVPQIGHGKGHGISNDDFGRSPITRDPADRYRFRTPTLLNVE